MDLGVSNYFICERRNIYLMDIFFLKKSVIMVDGKFYWVDVIGFLSVLISFGLINLSNILYVLVLYWNFIFVDVLNRYWIYKKCLVFDNGLNKIVIVVGNWDFLNRFYIFCNK